MNKTLKIGLGCSALLALAAIGAGVLHVRAQAASKTSAAGVPATKVAVAVAEQSDLPGFLTGIGSLEATRQVLVTAETSGLISRILFYPGGRVRTGQVLVQLNDAPEQGDLARLKAQASNARAMLERTRRLLPQQAATQEQLDQAQSAYDQTEGEIRRTQALIEQKRIKAPFDGVLGVRRVNLGQFVHTGDGMVSLTDSHTLYANVTLPERALREVRPDQVMTVAVDAHPNRRFTGKVSTIEPQIDSGTRTLLVQATLENTDGALTPGMYVNARVALPPRPAVVTVPETAVSYSAYGEFVYVLQDMNPKALSVRQSYVKTGEHIEGKVVVTEGIHAGERVVTSGQLRLHNGAAVQVVGHDTVAVVPNGSDVARQ
ncbi:efflux RND transporter periplasmic adaptor subunit [Cupriavidus sp. 2MCAB6]|uniref:efflux RND transporter periplasmic adaptor subunit n=1 Tax=Cupriavidus sp. 2MCAB6 TaxID=3232981 RepID=UPI003F907D21